MQIKLILALFGLGLLSSCGDSNPWQRSPEARRKNPGTLVAQVNKSEMQKFLMSEGLEGRVISENPDVFEIDAIDTKTIKEMFPEALVVQDKKIQFFDKKSESYEDRILIKLTPEEAAERVRLQLAHIGLAAAQKKSLGEGVVVAVIDSGVNDERWDLKPNMWVNSKEIPGNNKDDDGNGYVDDIHGWNFPYKNNKLIESLAHGTMSAALISSSLTGIAPKARIMGLRVINENGTSSYSDIFEAFQYAFKNGADLINISMSGPSVTDEVLKIIELLNKNDIFISMSAGNFSDPCEKAPFVEEFSKLSNLLIVGALNLSAIDPQLARYSNYGACVDIVAPSGEGQSAEEVYMRGIVAAHPFKPDTYFLYHGTSAAAPVVAGVATLVKALHPEWTGSQIAAHLLKTANLKSNLKEKVRDGAVIDAAAVVK